MGWCLVLVLLVGAVDSKVAKFSSIEASLIIAHHSTFSTVIAPLLIHGPLTLKSWGWLGWLRSGSLEL